MYPVTVLDPVLRTRTRILLQSSGVLSICVFFHSPPAPAFYSEMQLSEHSHDRRLQK